MRFTLRFAIAASLCAAAFCSTPCVAADEPAARPRRQAAALDLGPAPIEFITAELAQGRRLRSIVGGRAQRKLAEAHVRFDLHSQFSSDPERDPFYDRTRSAVRSGYLKLYKEMLRQQLPLDDLVERAIDSRVRTSGADGSDGRSWRLRVSPRVAIGKNGYLGARLSLPRTGLQKLDHMQLNVRRNTSSDEWALGVRYSDGPRFFQLERVAGDDETGMRYSATVVLRF
jgi:hypothetical protein